MKSNNFELIDCTLRDGGYINNWSFNEHESKSIISELSESNIEIIEVGFLQSNLNGAHKSIYAHIKDIKKSLPKTKKNTKYAAMIALGKNEIKLEDIQKNDGTIDILRITFHLDEIEKSKAIDYCNNLKEKGYKVSLQPVGSSQFTDKQLLNLIKEMNIVKPYAFYLVDTLGVLTPDKLKEKMSLIDSKLSKDIKIGFHSHNNLQLSFCNSLSLLKNNYKHDLIIDSSLMGMGRGAGNLPTELIANYLNQTNLKSYKMNHILKPIDEIISPLKRQFSWGYNTYYYLSAKNGCHPDYASYLLNKQTLPVEQVDKLLRNIPTKYKTIYNNEIIKKLYFNCQINNKVSTKSYSKLKKEFKNRKILVLGPGSTINSYSYKISKFVKQTKPIIISVNTIIDKFSLDYLFVSNRKRFDELIFPIKYKTIFTSNLPNTYKANYIVNYNNLIIKDDEGDNALIILLKLLIAMGIQSIHIAGFDGFSSGINNYYHKKINLTTDDNLLDKKNTQISFLIKKIRKGIKVKSLTPTKYKFN